MSRMVTAVTLRKIVTIAWLLYYLCHNQDHSSDGSLYIMQTLILSLIPRLLQRKRKGLGYIDEDSVHYLECILSFSFFICHQEWSGWGTEGVLHSGVSSLSPEECQPFPPHVCAESWGKFKHLPSHVICWPLFNCLYMHQYWHLFRLKIYQSSSFQTDG